MTLSSQCPYTAAQVKVENRDEERGDFPQQNCREQDALLLSLESTPSLLLAQAFHLHSCRSSFFQQVTETEASSLNAHGDKGLSQVVAN